MHGSHHVAQISSTTTLPLNADSLASVPLTAWILISGAALPMERSLTRSPYFSRSVFFRPSISFGPFRRGQAAALETLCLGPSLKRRDLSGLSRFGELSELFAVGDLFLVGGHLDLTVGIPCDHIGDQSFGIVVVEPGEQWEKGLDRRLDGIVVMKDLDGLGPGFDRGVTFDALRKIWSVILRASIASVPSGFFSAIERKRCEKRSLGACLSNLNSFYLAIFPGHIERGLKLP